MDSKTSVTHDAKEKRFKFLQENTCGYLNYEIDGDAISLQYVFVPDFLRGKNIAALLVCEALQYAKEHDLTVVPVCPYVQAYMRRKGLLS